MSEQETATTPETPTTAESHGETFRGDIHGIRAAAEEIAEKRRSEEAETELSLQEAREAVAQVQERRQAEKKGVELVEATKKHQENLSRENLTPSEAADVLATERGLARAQAESDLNEILGERREAEAQPQQQPQPQPVDNEAQARLAQHVQAQKLQAADAAAAANVSKIAYEYHSTVARAKAAFPELVGKDAAESAAIIAQLPPARQRQFQELDTYTRRLEGAAQAWQAERQKYVQIATGVAQKAEADRLRAWGQAEDQKAIQKIPELQNPDTAKKFQDTAVKVLEDAGLGRQEMATLMQNPQFRSVGAQLVIAEAVRHRLAREGLEAKKAKPKPVPKVQKPGSSYGFRPSGATITNLSRELSSTKGDKQVRLAAQLLAARRNARGA